MPRLYLPILSSSGFWLPFLLFLACRSSRRHQVFCRLGGSGGGVRGTGTCVRQEVTDDTNANVPFAQVTRGWRGRKAARHSAAYLSATQVMTRLIDAATVRGGIPRMPAIPELVARAACACKHLQEVASAPALTRRRGRVRQQLQLCLTSPWRPVSAVRNPTKAQSFSQHPFEGRN